MNISSLSINRPVLATVIPIFLVLFGVIGVTDSFACDCKPTPTVEDALRSSDLVIHGRVIKAEYNKQLEQDRAYLDSLGTAMQRKFFGPVHVNEYTIVVEQAFKGASANDTIIIRTRLDPVTDCGFLLQNGSEHIIYATKVEHGDYFHDREHGATYTTSVCHRTRAYEKREVKMIGRTIGRSNRMRSSQPTPAPSHQ